MKSIRIFITILIGLLGSAAQSQNADIRQIGTITNPALSEISGIAPSRQYADRLWCVNDGENPPSLYSIGLNGELLETWNVQNVVNDDWEDIGWIDRKGESYLFIADVGDNDAKRVFVRIHLIRSEDLKSDGTSTRYKTKPTYSFAFQYEDGPRDCEAVSYDSDGDRLLLVSKRTKPPILYALSLHPLDAKILRTANRLIHIKGFTSTTGANSIATRLAERAYKPTAMDLSPFANYAAVLTYGPILLYKRDPGTDWPAAFSRKPMEIQLPLLRQSESVCFSRDGKSIYMTSENVPAPIFRVNLK